MASRFDQLALSPAVLQAAQCQFDFLCFDDQERCRTETFLDRDLQLVRCLAREPCQHVQSYQGMAICNCPVKRALL